MTTTEAARLAALDRARCDSSALPPLREELDALAETAVTIDALATTLEALLQAGAHQLPPDLQPLTEQRNLCGLAAALRAAARTLADGTALVAEDALAGRIFRRVQVAS